MGALGLAFVYMGKFDEAKSVLEKIPGYEELPTFDEKKKNFQKKLRVFLKWKRNESHFRCRN